MNTQAEITKPNIVNGINVDDLMALLARVEQYASKGKTNWRVTTSWQGQTRSRSEVSGFGIGGEEVPRRFSFDIDEPCELGGSNAYANPQEHLIAALNACMTVGYDPDSMPEDLKVAHANLDDVVDRCYRKKYFNDDAERLE